MKRLAHIGLPTRALIGANALLVVVFALQLLFPVGPGDASAAGQTDTTDLLPDFGDVAINQPHLSELPGMLDRPLFFADRRLPAAPSDEPPAPPTPLRLKLEGVAMSTASRVAVLRNLANNQLMQLEEGGDHEGWTLDAVSSNSARFSRGEQLTELPLDPGTNNRR